ncbi:MAG: class I SAM-dependent methyltransferase [Syntrophomonadaceae bacterium]
MSNILSPEFWEHAWDKFRRENSYVIYNKDDQAKYWNARASNFTNHSGDNRTSEVLELLNKKGILQAGVRVLDIGCGPGLFTIPMASQGIFVVAVDPADKMLALLKDKLPAKSSSFVTTIEALWEDIDIISNGWINSFDLVFASMSPAINSLATLRKMISCSRKWCYLSGFAGIKQFELLDSLWLTLVGKPYREHFNDIIFPFNIIYSLGYKPEITYKTSITKQKEETDLLKQQILNNLSQEIKLTPEVIEYVHNFLTERSYQGIIEHNITSTVGMMIWKVD